MIIITISNSISTAILQTVFAENFHESQLLQIDVQDVYQVGQHIICRKKDKVGKLMIIKR